MITGKKSSVQNKSNMNRRDGEKGETMLKLWICSATYSDGRNKQYYGCLVYAECADDAFRYLDERGMDLGLLCLCKSVQGVDNEIEVK